MNKDLEELIEYILSGYSNLDLKKFIQNRNIKINGFNEINYRNRNIILKKLMTRKNSFEIYKLLSDSNKNIIEYKEELDIPYRELLEMIDNADRKSIGLISYYLTNMIIKDGIEQTFSFWMNNRIELIEFRKIDQIEKDNKQDKTTNNEKKFEFEIQKLEKKLNKERQKWQSKINSYEKKLNDKDQEIKRVNEVYVDIKQKFKEFNRQNKREIQKNEQDKQELEKKVATIGKLQKEISELCNKNDLLINKNIKKNTYIDGLEKKISELNLKIEFIEKKLPIKKFEEVSNEELQGINEENIKLENISLFDEFDYNSNSKKILVFGDLLGLPDYNDNLFDIYTSTDVQNHIYQLNESDYKEVWLIKYRFSKKSQRNQVLKHFKSVKIINNFKELEGVYADEL